MKQKIITKIATLALVSAASSAFAGAVPDSYNMLNGYTGSYSYWDESYNGSGCVTCDNAPLSGGRGDLTDGIIPTDNWFITEAPVGNGPYVGWVNIDPEITFHWNSPVNVTSVTFYFDDSNGAGGVSAPSSVDVNGTNFPIADPVGSAPFSFVASGLSFTGNDLAVTIHRNNAWVFLSEVQFNVSPVPEPETYAMLLAGLGLLGFTARRKKLMA